PASVNIVDDPPDEKSPRTWYSATHRAISNEKQRAGGGDHNAYAFAVAPKSNKPIDLSAGPSRARSVRHVPSGSVRSNRHQRPQIRAAAETHEARIVEEGNRAF